MRARKTSAAKARQAEQIAASFDHMGCYLKGNIAVNGLAARGRKRMLEFQKFRTNYSALDVRSIAGVCHAMSKVNWFLRPVLTLREASQNDGLLVTSGGEDVPSDAYNFDQLVTDIFWEDLRSSSVVALWRKGTGETPAISILHTDAVEYQSIGGVEIITIHCPAPSMRLNKVAMDAVISSLGEKMGRKHITGGTVQIVKGLDEEWDFEVMSEGGTSALLQRPAMESVLDPLDFMELMGIGDWNIAWYRKDIIRQVKKGYKGSGQQTSADTVNITKPQIKSLGEGMSKVNGNATIPMNHDVDMSYLTVDSKLINPEQLKTAIDKLMLYGGIEAAVLIGGFSQQNGAAPTLMRNARVAAWGRRKRVREFVRRIFSNAEFRNVQGAEDLDLTWSDRTLYSLEELLKKATSTADGTMSNQTRREMLDLNHKREGDRLKQEHADREANTPAFEPRQGLLPAMFTDLRKAEAPAAGAEGEPGRPPSDAGA